MTLVLAAGAFALFYVFLVPKPPQDGPNAGLPLSIESGDDGYQAIWRWLPSQNIPVAALLEPYAGLSGASAGLTPRGNLLMTTLPQRLPARPGELPALEAWVARGNTLLVMAALDDTPRWAIGANEGFWRILGRMTRLKFEAANAASESASPAKSAAPKKNWTVNALHALFAPQRILIEAKGPHPLFDRVDSMLAISEFPAAHWRASAMDMSPVLEIGQRQAAAGAAAPPEPAVWLKRQGEGQILIFGFASPFSNRVIAEKDNARAFSNLIAWSLGRGGTVIFDDYHQGAVSHADAKLFFHDPRLHRTLLWIVLLWLLFVLGSQRMRPSTDLWNPPDITNFIGITARFLSSAVTPGAAANRLFANFFNGVRRKLNLPEDGLPVWEWLAADARVPVGQLAELQRFYERVRLGRTVDLVRLHNMLSRLRGTLE